MMRTSAWGLWLAWPLMTSACLVDTDKPCGDALVEAEDGSCACPDGSILVDDTCSACGKHERVRSNSCVCESGYERSETGQCVISEPECDSGCSVMDESCSSSADCKEGWLCDVHDSQQCIEPPEGLGQACASDADCEGTDAEYCELFSSRTCQIDGCAEKNGVCPGDLVCCDYAVIARSLCIPSEELSEGNCPAPGMLVERQSD